MKSALTIINALRTVALAAMLFHQSLFAVETDNSEQEAVTWYQIEVIIFKNMTNNEQEKQHTAVELPDPNDHYVLVTGEPMVNNQLKRLPSDSLKFHKAYEAMNRNKAYEIIEFTGWKQALIKEEAGIPVLIKAGAKFGSHYELEGQLTFRKNRYLHVLTELYLIDYEEGTHTNLQQWFLEDDTLATPLFTFNSQKTTPTSALTSPLESERPSMLIPALEPREQIALTESLNSEGVSTEKAEHVIARHVDYAMSTVAQMSETRKMRSGEIHYLDHPQFGVLITIEPTDPPFVYNDPAKTID